MSVADTQIQVASHIISFLLQDYHENRHIQCKSVSRGLDKGSLFYMGIVKDGVRCGDNMICMNQSCVDLAPMSRHTKCPESIPPHGGRPVECSTNGVSADVLNGFITTVLAELCLVCVRAVLLVVC